MAKPDTAHKTNHHHLAAWGTFEELLLACAVKRHGLQAWDSVAMELQSRTSLPPPFTSPHHCELKYRDLRRRFSSLQAATTAASEGDSGEKVDSIPWLEDLRKLRVAELRQGIQQSDDSIMSLQTKVKELTEEREESLREDQTSQQEPDLAVESKENRSGNDNAASGGQPLASVAEKAASTAAKSAAEEEEESDRENRSVNGSNSTGLKSEKTGPEPKVDDEDEPPQPLSGSDKTDRVSDESRPEGMDSFNGSSEPNRRRRVAESEEPPESKENSSDVQSSASLTKKKKRGKGRRRVDEISVSGRGGESPVADNASPAANLADAKPQPLVDILKMIRAHDNSSLFERRPSVQEKDKYQSIVRQHMDLETIHTRLQKGSYSTCLFSFYRDLLLLFCNALVFYPKSSPESAAARELHRLVSTEIQKNTAPTRKTETVSKPDAERPDSLKSAAPIVVCRKRSSSITVSPVETKPPVKSSTSSLDDVIKIKEKSVTGARSLRRSNTSLKNNNSSGGKKPAIAAASEPIENPDPKKVDGSGSRSGSGKKRSAADFLKRMKNSPAGKSKEAVPEDSKVSGGNGGNDQKKKKTTGKVTSDKVSSGGGKNNIKEESGSPSKRTVGRPPKKVAGGGDSVAVGSKRGRDSATKEVAAAPATTPTPAAIKRPRKRR